MEACQGFFQVFLDSFDPSMFLQSGNDGLEALEKLHLYKLNQINSPHLSVLLKIIFLESKEDHKNLTFFASRTLEILTGYLSDKLQDEELLVEGFRLMSRNSANLTSCGYFGQFLKQLITKKNKCLERVLNMNTTSIILGSIESFTIGQVVQEIIENFPKNCGEFVRGLVELITDPSIRGATSCEVLKKSLNSKSLLSHISENEIFRLMKNQKGYGLKIVREILSLPSGSLIRKRALSTLFKNHETLSSQFELVKGERLIDLLEITRMAISSDFASLNYLIGKTKILEKSTVMSRQDIFFSNFWNSQLHMAYYSMLAAALNSGSNTIVESVFLAEVPQKIVASSLNPNVFRKNAAVRKGFMGFITKIGVCFRDSNFGFMKNMLKSINGWDRFLIYISQQEAIENGVLGARPRYRHLTADEISEYMSFDKCDLVESLDKFSSNNYWSVPLGEVDFL